MNPVDGGVAAPQDFRAAGVSARIKHLKSTKKDCALLVSDVPAAIAGVFTTNLVKAAPVLWTRDVCARGRARAVFANSGNANACTGAQGLEDARATAAHAAAALGGAPEEIAVLSTGVIGVPLPMDRILKGVDACIAALSPDGGADAAQAIMTTDTVPKSMAVEMNIGGRAVRIGAMAKGAGMISPKMATMLCVIGTDAPIASQPLLMALTDAVDQSFNRICVDNDMSTNDTVLCLANGLAGDEPIVPGSPDFTVFAEALEEICLALAQALVRDGEGATKFVAITVEGAASDADAERIARAVAASQLCKIAFFGQDPNWGRIACAAGYSGAAFDPARLCLWIGSVQVLDNGLPATYEEAAAAACMRERDIVIRIRVGDGPGRCRFWTSDLSHDYVRINADYRS